MTWDLRTSVKETLNSLFNKQEPFTILTVTNAVRQAAYKENQNIVRHREVRQIVEDLMKGEMKIIDFDYDVSRISVNVNGSQVNGVRLYHHFEYDPTDYLDTDQTLWEPTDGWNKKSRSIQMDSNLDDDNSGSNSDPKAINEQFVKIQNRRLILTIPNKITNQVFPNKHASAMFNTDIIVLDGKGTYGNCYKNNRIRIYGKMLRKLNKKAGDVCKLTWSINTNRVVIQ